MLAISRTARLVAVLTAASTGGSDVDPCPIWASRNTVAVPVIHRARRNRRNGNEARLKAAAVTPLTRNEIPAIAHHGPVVRKFSVRVDDSLSHSGATLYPARAR